MFFSPELPIETPLDGSFPFLEVGLAAGGAVLVALAIAVIVLLCRNKPNTQNSTQDEETSQEVWGPPTTQRTLVKREDSTYDDMYADAQEAKPRAPAKAEEEVKYETGYEEGEYLNL